PRIAGNSVDIGAFETQADLSISQTAMSTSVTQGDNITYTLTVANGGPSDSAQVTVTDTLPTGATFVSAPPTQGTCSGTTSLSCDLGSLASGAMATVTIVVTATQTGTLTNRATVTGDIPDPDSSKNSTSLDVSVTGTAASSSGGCGLANHLSEKWNPFF